MAVLRFSFGTMGSGKSTLALQIHHNLTSRGLRGLLCTQLDRDGARVSSRLGVSATAVDVSPQLDLFELARADAAEHGGIDHLVCDEAQFYTPAQVEQLARVVDELDADVHALGLLTDFRGRLFAGSARFLELADERQELQVEARCWCGARATQNARLVDGVQVYDGDVVVVGDTSGDGHVSYELLCRRHWQSGETGRAADSPAALDADDLSVDR
jgi:thymidine kinase